MKKLMIFLAMSVLLLLGSNAFAFSLAETYFDFTNVDGFVYTAPINDDGDVKTATFAGLSYNITTTSEIDGATGTDPGYILDKGEGSITALEGLNGLPLGDDEGLNAPGGEWYWSVDITWDNLEGRVVSSFDTTSFENPILGEYYSGQINFDLNYYKEDSPGSGTYTLTTITPLAVVDVTSGSYELDVIEGSAGNSYVLNGDMTVIAEDIWFLASGEDLYGLVQDDMVIAFTEGDTSNLASVTTFSGSLLGEELIVESAHNSTIYVGVVPEPTTLLLLGFGLIGVAGVSRRKI